MGFARVLLSLLLVSAPVEGAQPLDRSAMTAAQLYDSACAACHAPDGRGTPIAVRGFSTDPPDFTDCSLTTPEADIDWYSVIHRGGTARGFDPMMPAFGDELTDAEIGGLIEYVRRFCTERGWPHGDLNLPRALVTEKAYPENETVLTVTAGRGTGKAVSSLFLYEHRVGRRGQYEIFARDVEAVGGAYKHVLFDSRRRGSIVSGGGEITLQADGSTVEAFAAFSQGLPARAIGGDGFLHAQAGVEAPASSEAGSKAMFWRLAIGKTYMEDAWGRSWSPMIELLAARAFDTPGGNEWDVLPQVQISLSRRQHVLLNAGVRVPLTHRSTRRTSVMTYLLWDWFDGSLVSGW